MGSRIEGPRACRPDERSELLALANLVFRVSRGRWPSIERDSPHVYRTENLGNVRVIRADGGLRASVGTLHMRIAAGGAVLDTVGVNCTTTHPDWRKRGFGGLLMRDVEERARAAGRDLVHLDAGVPEWYRRFGFEDGGCLLTYELNRGNVGLLPDPADLEIGIGLARYAAQLHRIHTADGAGTIRSEEDVPVIVGRTSPELFVAERRGQVVAYAVVQPASRLVKEHGGPPELVAALLRAVYARVDAVNEGRSTTARDDRDRVDLTSGLQVEVIPQQAGLIALLDRIGVPVARAPWHMLQLIDPAAVLRKLGLNDVAVSRRGDLFVLSGPGGEEALTRRMLVKALFGPERVTEVAGDRLPVLLSTPSTDHV
ncbi:MAG: GNAT family N-acetyltransferase [Spirochaetaceae bacterium]|nr:GNAT family N-acetyltransferase [Spirochaetaceae bacterium]